MEFSFNKISNNNIDTIQLKITDGNVKLETKEYSKQGITELEAFSLIYLSMFSYQKRISSINLSGFDDEGINISNRLNRIFRIKDITLDKMEDLSIDENNKFLLNPKDIGDELKNLSQENLMEISCFYYKSLKKYIFNIDIVNKGILVHNDIFSSEYVSLSDGKLVSDLSKYIDELQNGNEYNITFKVSEDKRQERSLAKKISEKLEVLRDQKIENKNSNNINIKELSYQIIRNNMRAERDKQSFEMKKSNNLTLFTDGSSKEAHDSASFIIKHNGGVIKNSYLFDEGISVPYEEIALLKGLQNVLEMDVKGDIYIVCDKEDNLNILNKLQNNEDIEEGSVFKKLFDNVKSKFNKISGKNIIFIAVKSHTRMVGYDFDGNREVDEDASRTIEARELITSKNDFKNLEDDNLIGLNIDEAYKKYCEKKEIEDNKSPYKDIMNKKNKSLSNRSIFKSNAIYSLTREYKGKKYALLLYVNNGAKRRSEFISYEDISDYKRQLDSYINRLPKSNFDNLKIFSRDEGINEANKELVLFDSVVSKTKLSKLVEKSQICVYRFDESINYQKEYKHFGLKKAFNLIFNEKVLGIKPEKKIKKETDAIIVKPEVNLKPIIEPIQFQENNYIGNQNLFPLSHELNQELDYLFISKKNNEYILKYLAGEQEISHKIKDDENYLHGINNFLREQPQKKGRRNKGFIITVPDAKILKDFDMAMKGEDFFKCNLIKVLHKKFKDPKLLIVQNKDFENKANVLQWYKDKFKSDTKKRLRMTK